jgi:hypothetical protein
MPNQKTNNRIAILAATLSLGLVLPSFNAQAQAPERPAIRRARILNALGKQNPNPEVRRAREIMALFLRQGSKQPYIGEQTTQVMAGGLESTQIVKHRGPLVERIQFLTPSRMSGEIILQYAGRFQHYKPSQNVVLEGVASPEVFQGQVKEILQGIKSGKISVRVVGSQTVAEQAASIVEMRTPEGGWRLWIDNRTGVRLKSEQLNAQGSVSVTTYFTKIDYAPTFDPKDFNAGSLPRVRHEASLPSGPPLANVQAAQQLVDYTIREPAIPAGFRLSGVWVVELPGSHKVSVLRYTDGPNNFTLFEQKVRQKVATQKPLDGKPFRRNLRHWVAGDISFSLLGNLRPASLEQIVDSLQ